MENNQINQQQKYQEHNKIYEKVLLEAVKELRATRRWGIFFKIVLIGLVFLVLGLPIILIGSIGFAISNFNFNNLDSNVTNVNSINQKENHVAVIKIHGPIIADNPIGNYKNIDKSLDKAFKNKNSVAIVLDIDSPGGSAYDSSIINEHVKILKQKYPDKPVYALIGKLGTSGAYMVAAAADTIYANKHSIIGSIGVISDSINYSGTLEKLGLKRTTKKAGTYKDIGDPAKPETEFEKQFIEDLLNKIHQNFIDIVIESRANKLKIDNQGLIFSGLFWDGQTSLELGLIDGFTTKDQLINNIIKVDNVVEYNQEDTFEKFFKYIGTRLNFAILKSQPTIYY